MLGATCGWASPCVRFAPRPPSILERGEIPRCARNDRVRVRNDSTRARNDRARGSELQGWGFGMVYRCSILCFCESPLGEGGE